MKEHTRATFTCWLRYNQNYTFSEKLIIWWKRNIGEMSIQGYNATVSDNVYHGDMDESQCQDSEVLLRFHYRERRQSITRPRVDMYIQKTSAAEKEQALVTLSDRKANLGERL